MVLNQENKNTSSSQMKNTTPISTVDLKMFHQEQQQNQQNQENSFNTNTTTDIIGILPENDDKLILQQTSIAQVHTTANNESFCCSKGLPKLWRKFIKKWPIISELFALFIIFILLWLSGYSLIPKYFQLNSSIMKLLYLFIGAKITGILFEFIFYLPDMLGMLFFGILFTNIKGNENLFNDELSHHLQVFCRQLALVNIMLLVGLGLNYEVFKKFFGMVTRLTILPIVAEVILITILAKILLSMPYLWGALLGLVITAISPNVVVSVMLDLEKQNLGTEQGIQTIVYGMTAICDIFAVLSFQILLKVILSSETTQSLILNNVMGIGIGIAYGGICGLVLIYLPHYKAKYANALRLLLITFGGIVAVVGTEAIKCPSGGVLGCTILAFVAGEGWRKCTKNGSDDKSNYTGQYLQLMWSFLKPISFSLIGIGVKFAGADIKVFGYGIIITFLGVLIRLLFSYISMYGKYLTWKERAYITICGLPKATIQAALGPLALDAVQELTKFEKNHIEQILNAKHETYAKNILVISVLAIVLTAPLGAILMIRLASKCLRRSTEDQTTTAAQSTENTNL